MIRCRKQQAFWLARLRTGRARWIWYKITARNDLQRPDEVALVGGPLVELVCGAKRQLLRLDHGAITDVELGAQTVAHRDVFRADHDAGRRLHGMALAWLRYLLGGGGRPASAERLRRRAEFLGTLIVAVTGWGQEADVERSRAAGFDHHLVKPASPEAIVELLRKVGEGER